MSTKQKPQPLCAHLNILYERQYHDGGLCSDSWVCRDCRTPFVPMSTAFLGGLADMLTKVSQVFDGWHADGTAWSEWDESVRKSVSDYALRINRWLSPKAEPASPAPDTHTYHYSQEPVAQQEVCRHRAEMAELQNAKFRECRCGRAIYYDRITWKHEHQHSAVILGEGGCNLAHPKRSLREALNPTVGIITFTNHTLFGGNSRELAGSRGKRRLLD